MTEHDLQNNGAIAFGDFLKPIENRVVNCSPIRSAI